MDFSPGTLQFVESGGSAENFADDGDGLELLPGGVGLGDDGGGGFAESSRWDSVFSEGLSEDVIADGGAGGHLEGDFVARFFHARVVRHEPDADGDEADHAQDREPGQYHSDARVA